MKISDQISLSARNLSRRKGRTALTLIGVVIGTCMVVLMISLGIAQTASNDEMLQQWGDLTSIEVYSGGNLRTEDGKTLYLNDAMLEQFRQLEHVLGATPYLQDYTMQGSVSAGNNNRYQISLNYGGLVGIDPAAMEPMGFTLESGNWLPVGPANKKATKLQVLVCQQTAYSFQDTRKSENSPKRQRYYGDVDASGNPVSPFVDINEEKMTLTLSNNDTANPKTKSWELEVVGTLTPDTSKGWWIQNSIIVRLQDAVMLRDAYTALTSTATGSNKKPVRTYDSIYIKVDDLDNVTAVEKAVEGLGFSADNIYSMNQQREVMQQQVMRQQMIFGGIAAVSLLVAAINIINTMTMAIYERTREIGIMKVLGCEVMSIRSMFLLESSGIGFLGGLIGVVLSVGASTLLNHLGDIAAAFGGSIDLSGLMGNGAFYYSSSGASVISIIPPWLLLAALLFATLIGLVAGILPANKAVQISALEAIRHD